MVLIFVCPDLLFIIIINLPYYNTSPMVSTSPVETLVYHNLAMYATSHACFVLLILVISSFIINLLKTRPNSYKGSPTHASHGVQDYIPASSPGHFQL